VLSGISSGIVRVRSRDELFRDVCRIAVGAGQFRMAWVGVVDCQAHAGETGRLGRRGTGILRHAPLALTETKPEGQGWSGTPSEKKARDLERHSERSAKNDEEGMPRARDQFAGRFNR